MPYIPKEHEKYKLLPLCREDGGEVFDYPSKLLSEVGQLLGSSKDIMPYNFESYEEYFKKIDDLINEYKEDSRLFLLLTQLKEKVRKMNQKEEWSIVRYIGPTGDCLVGVTHGKYYYWPSDKDNPIYRGVIDDEEFTAYLYPTESYMWEILEDPTGMAKRTIYEKADGYLSESEHKQMIEQLSEILD